MIIGDVKFFWGIDKNKFLFWKKFSPNIILSINLFIMKRKCDHISQNRYLVFRIWLKSQSKNKFPIGVELTFISLTLISKNTVKLQLHSENHLFLYFSQNYLKISFTNCWEIWWMITSYWDQEFSKFRILYDI